MDHPPWMGCMLVGLSVVVCASCDVGLPHSPMASATTAPSRSAQAASTLPARLDTMGSAVRALPISSEAADATDPESLDAGILHPVSCVVEAGVATATGSFGAGEVPEAYQRVGAVVELYVYATPSEPADPGRQLAILREESPFPMQGSGSWIVRAPLEARLGAPATCEVAVQPMHSPTPRVSAPSSSRASPRGVTALSIAVQSVGGSGALTIPEPSVLHPEACTMQGDFVTATGTFEGGHAPERSLRSGAVVEVYVYASPTISSPEGMQVADLALEHTFPMVGAGPWTVTVPVDPELGKAVRCGVTVQRTHHFEAGENAY